MQNVVADLAVESEAATALGIRLAGRTVDDGRTDRATEQEHEARCAGSRCRSPSSGSASAPR
jgi:hypothetical protein